MVPVYSTLVVLLLQDFRSKRDLKDFVGASCSAPYLMLRRRNRSQQQREDAQLKKVCAAVKMLIARFQVLQQ